MLSPMWNMGALERVWLPQIRDAFPVFASAAFPVKLPSAGELQGFNFYPQGAGDASRFQQGNQKSICPQ